MNEDIYKIYKKAKQRLELRGDELVPCWGIYSDRYEQETKIQQSFTDEQINFIKMAIHAWSIEWNSALAIQEPEGEKNRLSMAADQLKSMIFGNEQE